jgi:hypothetical protein
MRSKLPPGRENATMSSPRSPSGVSDNDAVDQSVLPSAAASRVTLPGSPAQSGSAALKPIMPLHGFCQRNAPFATSSAASSASFCAYKLPPLS